MSKNIHFSVKFQQILTSRGLMTKTMLIGWVPLENINFENLKREKQIKNRDEKSSRAAWSENRLLWKEVLFDTDLGLF